MDTKTAGAASRTWLPVPALDGVWRAERVVNGVPLRSLAVRLADGRLVIYSPIRGLGRAAHAELTALGAPAFLVAPNHFHNLGLAEYAAAHADARIVSSPTAAPRVQRRCGREVHDPALLRDALPANMSLLLPPGSRAGELWLSIGSGDGRAWTVGDAFFNIARTPRTPMGLLLWLLGISSGLRIGSSFRWLLRDRAGYKRWLLDAVATQRPTTLVPCHGDILTDPALPERLRRLVARRL